MFFPVSIHRDQIDKKRTPVFYLYQNISHTEKYQVAEKQPEEKKNVRKHLKKGILYVILFSDDDFVSFYLALTEQKTREMTEDHGDESQKTSGKRKNK